MHPLLALVRFMRRLHPADQHELRCYLLAHAAEVAGAASVDLDAVLATFVEPDDFSDAAIANRRRAQ